MIRERGEEIRDERIFNDFKGILFGLDLLICQFSTNLLYLIFHMGLQEI